MKECKQKRNEKTGFQWVAIVAIVEQVKNHQKNNNQTNLIVLDKVYKIQKNGWLIVWKKTKKREQNREKIVSEVCIHQHSRTCPSWLFFCVQLIRMLYSGKLRHSFHWCAPGFFYHQAMYFAMESTWFPTNEGRLHGKPLLFPTADL